MKNENPRASAGERKRFRPVETGRLSALVLCLILATFPWGVAQAAADTDACSLLKNDDIQQLIAAGEDELRSTSRHPAPGNTQCVWSAHRKNLTDDAPADATLTLDFYHFVNATRAKGQLQRLGVPEAPRLTQTDSPDDQVVHRDRGNVIARHSVDVAVMQVELPQLAWDRPGWTYLLEALALRASGAHVLGPAGARATADVCHLIEPQHVLGLLTLTRSTLDSRPDGARRCTFNVKDQSGKPDGWVANHGGASFEREDLGNSAAAIARQRLDLPFFRESHLVSTADPTDRVVPNPDHPEEISAVHGPYLVRLNITEATPAALAAPGWAYRAQRAALEVAGATITGGADQPPDSVVPGPKPPKPHIAWQPAAYPPPAGSAVFAPVLHVLWRLAVWRFLVMPVGIAVPVLLVVLLKPRRLRVILLVPLCILFAVLNLVFGTRVGVLLIHHFGVQAQATVVGSYATSTQYNNRDVVGHNVLIRTQGGQVVEAVFEDDDFNVYPPHNATRYPSEGVEFTVRYPIGYPKDFVIISDDGSPWATSLRCGDLAAAADQADRKLDFAPNSAALRAASEAAHRALQDGGCERGDSDES